MYKNSKSVDVKTMTSDPNEETITIPKKEYDELMHDSLFLSCLDAAGVDNWDGYDYAREMMDKEDE